jgi:hypothetical protein
LKTQWTSLPLWSGFLSMQMYWRHCPIFGKLFEVRQHLLINCSVFFRDASRLTPLVEVSIGESTQNTNNAPLPRWKQLRVYLVLSRDWFCELEVMKPSPSSTVRVSSY